MRKVFIFLSVIILIVALATLNGFRKMGSASDDDPMTENQPERIAHRDAVYAECLDGSVATPDELYCRQMADKTNAHYTELGFLQEVLHHGTFGIVPRYYYTPTPAEELKIRLEAERFAASNGADGSSRFTGAKVALYEEQLDQAYAESDVFQSKAERCDPEGETMKAIMKMRPGESVEQLHRGMDCEGWDR